MNNIYRLKFAYKGVDDDGAVKLVKTEHLAECMSYTEAEKVAYAIADREGMDRFDDYVYEIIKTKLSTGQIVDNGTLEHSQTLVCGLTEHFFRGDYDGMFLIKAKSECVDEKGKMKGVVDEYLVCDKAIVNAINCIKQHLQSIAPASTTTILSSKLDAADRLFVSSPITQYA